MSIEKKISRTYITISITIVSILLIFFFLKSPIIRFVLSQKVKSFELKYPVNISYSKAYIKGINTIFFESISVTLIKDSVNIFVSDINITIPFENIVKFDISPSEIDVGEILISIRKCNNVIDNSVNEEIVSEELSLNNSSYTLNINPRNFYRVLKAIDHYAETDIIIDSIGFEYLNNNQLLKASCMDLMITHGNLSTEIIITETDSTKNSRIQTDSRIVDNRIYFKAFSKSNKKVEIPLIEKMLGLTCKFDTLDISFNGEATQRDRINLQFNLLVNNLQLNYKQLSDTVVKIDYTELNVISSISPKEIIIDSISNITINKTTIPFNIELNTNESVRLKISSGIDSLNSKDLFESMPRYLFPNIDSIKVSGFVKYNFQFEIDLNEVDSLYFSSKLTPLDFRIESFGKIDFRTLNDSLTHEIFVNDSTSKIIILHASQPYYCSFKNISPYLINAVIVSEDGGFFNHKGFDSNGFSYAMAQNIKNRQLARGGSTITMQLVKNLYLNRSKTITRKIEEAIIVWLIETQKLLDKERILEIYFNIIEWGPEIYGVTEASEFYFNKEPSMINLNEAIFLASIIPRPSQFFKSFDKKGNLKDYYYEYYSFVSEIMLERNLITEEDIETLSPIETLTGPAMYFLEIDSTLSPDSLIIEDSLTGMQ